MAALGMCSLFYTITPSNVLPAAIQTIADEPIKSQEVKIPEKDNLKANRSISSSPVLYSYMSAPKEAIARYLFGYHAKTKRSLAEEAENGDEISVCSWIRDGCDPNEEDHYGYTPLLNASALGRINAVGELIKNGALINKVGPFGFTALHAAAQNGHREVVALLLKNGADINAQNEDKDTPMHLALRAHRIEIVYMLLRNGGNSRIQGFLNKDCIRTAKEAHLFDLAETLKTDHQSAHIHFHHQP